MVAISLGGSRQPGKTVPETAWDDSCVSGGRRRGLVVCFTPGSWGAGLIR